MMPLAAYGRVEVGMSNMPKMISNIPDNKFI